MTREPVKFLVVDDVEDNLVALEALLRRDELQVLLARSGTEALELLLVHDVALALLDVQMPGMDGFELAELMRGSARTKHIPIIFVTAGSRDPQRMFKGYESGAVDFLYKPIEPRILAGKADVFFDLYRQRRDLADALRLNELFVGILGHDLRNPLGTMLTGARLLEHQTTEEPKLRTLRRMVSAGTRMVDMVDQLLDLTRARLGGGLGMVRVRTALDVAALANRTVDELRGAHHDREIRVTSHGDCTTSGDPERLVQLFSNVVGNAIQHGVPGTPVSVEVSDEGDEICTRIANQGVIPPDILPVIFDPFRSREGASTNTRGLGLGLFISEQIAIAHGGRVDVVSNEESGTVFTVRIPRRAIVPSHASFSQPRTVLVVDDDEAIVESLRESFEREGYSVVIATDGREALDRLANGTARIDAVILDLVMPVLGGDRVLEAMRREPKLASIPVIVSTATPERAPAGAIVVRKPVRFETLLLTLDRVLSVPSAVPTAG